MLTDHDFYKNTFHGSMDEESFLSVLPKAEAIITACVSPDRYPVMSDDDIRIAVCFQAEYMAGEITGFSSFKLGDFSISGGGAEKKGIISPYALAALEKTGLVYRGTGVRS